MMNFRKYFRSLHGRTMLTMLTILLIMILSIYLLLHRMLTQSLISLEDDYIREHVERAVNAVDSELRSISISTKDWALWTDTYTFVDDLNTEYIQNNLNPETLINFGINYICYLDRSGKPVYEFAVNRATGSFSTPNPAILAQLSKTDILTNQEEDCFTEGILSVDDNLLLLAASPILTSTHEGPVNGNLIFGRYLDADQIARISGQLELDMDLYALTPDGSDAPEAFLKITPDSNLYIERLSPTQVNAYRIQKDLLGQPVIGYCLHMDRGIYATGMENMRLYVILLIFIGIVFAFITLIFLQRNVLSRLESLSLGIAAIGQKGIATRLVQDKFEDEVHFVIDSINKMLDQLEKTQLQLSESEERYKALNEVLEKRVSDRTLELTHANETLRYEIRERLKIQDRIQYLAYHDPLTNLPNRLLLSDRLKQALPLAARTSASLAVLYLDLDGFKMVNDTLGHDQGDEMLKIVSSRLVKALRREDTVARIGGDEFIVLIQNIKSYEAVSKVAEKIISSFQTPFKIKNQDFFITTSIGIAISPADGEDIHTLLKNSDIALYRAKDNGKNRAVFCSPRIKDEVFENIRLTNHLYRAVEHNELLLHYQPQINQATGRLVGLEALVRWNHPEYGMISPGRFIPIAEQTGLILPIGEFILRTACAQAKAWQTAGFGDFTIGVNLSVNQFKNPSIAQQIAQILDETGLAPQFLDLEITESIAMKESDKVVESLNKLKQLGIKISIDDFGTDYSSFNYLKRLPVDKLKLDMNFIRGIGINIKDEIILEGMITLARNLGLNVIAEGVETESQLHFLARHRCEEIQGYYFYPPQPAELISDILLARGAKIGGAVAQTP